MFEDLLAQAQKAGVKHFVVGAFIVAERQILILRRRRGDFWGGYYEIPGGGVEKNETLSAAVIREVLEETGLKTKTITAYVNSFDYLSAEGERTRQFNFEVTTDSATPVLSEHDHYAWIGPDTKLAPYPLSEKMQLCIQDYFAHFSSSPPA
ncbi:MAG: NUDIX hydrolase [Parachlamydiales bacterium]|jgi:8-oxo-dGTP diphosphatase